MTGAPVRLTERRRQCVRQALVLTCRAKNWYVHAIHVGATHVHIVLAAPDQTPERVMTCLKAWASRKLNEQAAGQASVRWWTRHGSTRWLKIVESVKNAVDYVRRQSR